MIFLLKKIRIFLLSALAIMTILLFSGCDYSTKVISSAEPPDKVFDSFISAVKCKDFATADSFLSNGTTIEPQNETGYSFFDDYVDTSLDMLAIDTTEEPEFDGMNASMRVWLISISQDDFVAFTNKNLLSLEHDYLVKNDLSEFDNSDRKAVDSVLSLALRKYAKSASGSTREVTVSFVFTGKGWKIEGNEDLVKAIFGGSDNEGQNEKSKEKSGGND